VISGVKITSDGGTAEEIDFFISAARLSTSDAVH